MSFIRCFRILAILIVAVLLATMVGVAEELPVEVDAQVGNLSVVEVMEMEEPLPVDDDPGEAEDVDFGEDEAENAPQVEEAPAVEAQNAPAETLEDAQDASDEAEALPGPTVQELEAAPAIAEASPAEAVVYNEEDTGMKLAAEAATPTSIAVNANRVVLGKGERFQIVPQVNQGATTTFKYSVKNKKIAKVTKNGVIKGKKPGRTKVTVKTGNGLKAKITVIVKKAPKKITLSQHALNLQVSQQAQLTATLPKKSASAIHYISDNNAVAPVDGNGVVTAVGPGGTMLWAETFNGMVDLCYVTVTAPPAPPVAAPAPVDISTLFGKTIAEANAMIPNQLALYNNNFYINDYIMANIDTDTNVIKTISIMNAGHYNLFGYSVGSNLNELTTKLESMGYSLESNSSGEIRYLRITKLVTIEYQGAIITRIIAIL